MGCVIGAQETGLRLEAITSHKMPNYKSVIATGMLIGAQEKGLPLEAITNRKMLNYKSVITPGLPH